MAKNDFTYYQYLGIEKTATADEVKTAYRKCAKAYHPDSNPAPNASIFFQKVKEAYDVLSDVSARAAYDKSLAPQPEPPPSPEPPPRSETKTRAGADRHADQDPFEKAKERQGSQSRASQPSKKPKSTSKLKGKGFGVRLALFPVKVALWLIGTIVIGGTVFVLSFALYNVITRIVSAIFSFICTLMVFTVIYLAVAVNTGLLIFAPLFMFAAWITSPFGTVFLTEKVIEPLSAFGVTVKRFGKNL